MIEKQFIINELHLTQRKGADFSKLIITKPKTSNGNAGPVKITICNNNLLHIMQQNGGEGCQGQPTILNWDLTFISGPVNETEKQVKRRRRRKINPDPGWRTSRNRSKQSNNGEGSEGRKQFPKRTYKRKNVKLDFYYL